MALKIGDKEAADGLAKAVYLAINGVMPPFLKKRGLGEEIIDQSREAWKLLSYAVATGVVQHVWRRLPDAVMPEDEPPAGGFAETYSSAAEDKAFWAWFSELKDVLSGWQPVPGDGGKALKTRLNRFFNKPLPTELKGVLR